MTKDYHTTPEQALKLFDEAGGILDIDDKRPLTVSATDLANFANAVLDEVLGEPVAWAEAGREHNVIADLVKQTNKNGWVKPYTVALYAPK